VWSWVDYYDNSPCLALIEEKKEFAGIFALLDDECRKSRCAFTFGFGFVCSFFVCLYLALFVSLCWMTSVARASVDLPLGLDLLL
jgi:hypothetical protein